MSTGYGNAPGTADTGNPYSADPAVDLRREADERTARQMWTYDETRRGPATTEFWLTLVAVAGVLIATYVDSDSLARVDGWRFATWLVAAYVVSRGLSKIAVKDWHRSKEH